MRNENLAKLQEAVRRVAHAGGAEWLAAALISVREDAAQLAVCNAMARRKLGDAKLGANAPDLESAAGPVRMAVWEAGDAGRVALCLAACAASSDDAHDTLRDAFRVGDERERAAIVRGLALFPGAPALKPLALEAGRANSLVLFSALALDNPYPAAYYATQELNQMVLKALFHRLPIDRIRGLKRRAGPELARMCTDYIGELQAAGREVPSDAWRALDLGAPVPSSR